MAVTLVIFEYTPACASVIKGLVSEGFADDVVIWVCPCILGSPDPRGLEKTLSCTGSTDAICSHAARFYGFSGSEPSHSSTLRGDGAVRALFLFPFSPTRDVMETRLSPSMGELHNIARKRGLKYYMHLSKPELFALLQRYEGLSKLTKDAKEDVVQLTESAMTMRCSERLSYLKKKRKIRENDMAEVSRDKKKAKMIVNTIDPIMLVELGPHTVRVDSKK